MKNTRTAISNLDKHIQLVQRFSKRKASSFDYFTENKGYILEDLGLALDIRSITWSYWWWSGKISKSFLAKTDVKL